MNCKDFEQLLSDLPPACAWPAGRDSATSLPTLPSLIVGAGREHAASCERCAVVLARRLALYEALGSLGPVAVDPNLEGRVVAAMQAGYRQERVVARLESLEPIAAPPELDRAVRRLFTPHPAPAVLDRLVREQVERAETGPRSAEAGSGEQASRRLSRLRQITWLTGAAAAALVLWVGVRGTGDSPVQPLELDFEVVHVSSLEQAGIDGFLREQIVGLTGLGGDQR